MLDPKDFIITRKRKKYKFALFANSPLCFEIDEWSRGKVDVVELGAGNGLFSVELAEIHPDKQFVAIDVKGDRLQKGAAEAESRGLTNIRFLRARADQLLAVIDEKSVETIWLTFADPFPKKRSAGRRMTHPTYLNIYQKALVNGGKFMVKHDNSEFFGWSLEQLVLQRWYLCELSFDLHDSELSDDYKILTTYEKRWLGEGLVTKFVSAKPSKP